MNCVSHVESLEIGWMPKRKPYSFRPSPDVEHKLQRSIAATGARPADLLAACVERALDDVTLRLIDARRAAETEVLRDVHKTKDPPPKRKAG